MTKILRGLGMTAFVACAACASQPAADTVPIGQEVAVTKADGGVVQGKVAGRDNEDLKLTIGDATTSIPKNQIVDVKAVEAGKPVDLPPAATFREYTVPEGTTLSLTLATSVSSDTSKPGDTVEATLNKAVSVGDREVLPAGSAVKGTVTAAQGSGKVKGLASMILHFTSLTPPGRDDRYEIDASYSEIADATKGADAAKIGIGAGAGAAIGGVLGGKSGAAKGTVIGGGASTAVVLATTGKEVEHRAGATLRVALRRSVDVRVPIR